MQIVVDVRFLDRSPDFAPGKIVQMGEQLNVDDLTWWQCLVYEIIYQTLEDAYALCTGNVYPRFRSRQQDKRYGLYNDPRVVQGTLTKKRAELTEWSEDPLFIRCAREIGVDNPKATLLDLVDGKNLDRVLPFLKEYRSRKKGHAGRPDSPKEKENAEKKERAS